MREVFSKKLKNLSEEVTFAFSLSLIACFIWLAVAAFISEALFLPPSAPAPSKGSAKEEACDGLCCCRTCNGALLFATDRERLV